MPGSDPQRTPAARQRLHPLGAVALVLWAAGCLASVWGAGWRWAITGLIVFILFQAAGAMLDQRRKP